MVYCSVVEECFHANGGCAAAVVRVVSRSPYNVYDGHRIMCTAVAIPIPLYCNRKAVRQ